MKWVLISCLFLALGWLIWPRVHSATSMPEDGLEITLSIWPLQSLHSDWQRKVSIEYRGRRISERLFEDTGWWRGSNLYRHGSGTYVIHEGQLGCFSFTIDPLAFVDVPSGICTKREPPNRQATRSSRFYPEMEYLGHFKETFRDKEEIRLRFLDFRQSPEVELPDEL